MRKPQTTNYKSQTNSKLQITNCKRFEILNFFGNWVESKSFCFRRAKPGNSPWGRILEIGNSRKGFTLLETIVALTVIVAAMSGPFALATRGIFITRFAKNKLVAANLAQEGIELVRKIRDDNVLENRAWNFGIGGAGSEESYWRMDILSEELSPFVDVPLLRDSVSGIYNYTSGNETLFTRRIAIAKLDVDRTRVTARVTWEDAGIARTMTLGETLYNWR